MSLKCLKFSPLYSAVRGDIVVVQSQPHVYKTSKSSESHIISTAQTSLYLLNIPLNLYAIVIDILLLLLGSYNKFSCET